MASLVVGVGGLYGRAVWRTTDIDRVDVAGTAPVPAGDPVTVLVVGVDTRDAATTSSNPDTILLARIDPGAGTAGLLSLPRDLNVQASNGGPPVMINSVAQEGGLEALVGVVESQMGVPVDHVVEVGLGGFRALVDEIGGIDVRVDVPVRDTGSGLFLDDLGCVTLDGEEALALVRSRKVELLDETGTWVRDPLSDLSRVVTQRQVLLAALSGLGDESPDPVTLNRHVEWAVDHVTLDVDVDVDELARWARAAIALDPAAVVSATLPVMPDPSDENRLVADPERAPAAVEAFVSGRSLPSSGGVPTGSDRTSDLTGLPGGAIVDPC